jgi:NADPH:quinone reductase
MREIQAVRFGGPEVLEAREVPDPAPGPGQVVVEAAAVDTITIETLIRRGMARQWFPVEPPYVPGGGVAGRVASLGDGVDPGWAGRNVVTHAVVGGAYAERVVALAWSPSRTASPSATRPRSSMTAPPRSASSSPPPSSRATAC